MPARDPAMPHRSLALLVVLLLAATVQAGLITLVGPTLIRTPGIAVDAAGNVYIADPVQYAIKQWSPSTGQLITLVALPFAESAPAAVAVDAAGNVYVADPANFKILKWTAPT